MSDYTPTTDEVRDAYSDEDGFHPGRAAEFNRWLAAHDAEVREQAAQRAYAAMVSQYEGFGIDWEVVNEIVAAARGEDTNHE